MNLAQAIALVLVTLVASGCGSRPGAIEGRAVSRGAAVAGATVEIYLSAGRGKESTPFAAAATGADGSFRLELPSGSYWVWVKDLVSTQGPRRLAEYPANPVQLAAGATRSLGEVELHAVGTSQEPVAAPGVGVRGRVLYDGAPAGETAVMIYDAASTRLAGPGYIALVRTDSEGRFQIDLAPGPYRLAARRRKGGATSGYLQQGDSSATAPTDQIVVPPGGYLDLGDLHLHLVDADLLAAKGARGFQEPAATVVEGRVLDPKGQPRAGQFVFVYRDEGMIGRPESMVSTGANGEFELTLPGGGKYYLGARSRHGGPRQPGEWAGKLAGTSDSGLAVLAGRRVKGLTIVMEQVW
ncbi:MAG: hypothetical protein ACYC9Y_02920 [Candidatus Methylomirabilia bacterium]